MTTAGDNITKANITASMASIRDAYNTGIHWHSGNQPFQTDITGGNNTGYATQSFDSEISDTNVTASTLVANFKGYANLLSRIRSVRLQKWYQNGGDVRSSLQSDETQITNLNANYAADMAPVGEFNTISGFTAAAADIDLFVGALSTAINNNRTSTVLIEEFYCHSNCHGSCHGSL
jgi:hypothetical protein